MKKTLLFFTAITLSNCQVFTEDLNESFDIFIVAGQSNTNSGVGLDFKLDQPDSNTFQLGRNIPYDYLIIPAKEPLQHHTSNKGQIGFALSFTKHYNQNLNPQRRNILIIPCGYGGTSLKDEWTFDEYLYNDMIERATKTLKKFSNSTIKAILWHQGESDTGDKNYAELLDNFIKQTRTDLNQNVPFIVGGMVPYWVNSSQQNINQQNIIKDTPNRVENVEYADPEIPFVIKKVDDSVDAIHYDAPGQRELGKRYFTAYQTLHKQP